jgi:hypothetical protein
MGLFYRTDIGDELVLSAATTLPPSALDEIRIMERAVQAVNQGSAFHGATNIAPCDQSPSRFLTC